MSEYLGPVIALAFMALFAILIILAMRREKRRIQEKTEILAGLGFELVNPPDPAFVDRVVQLRTRWGRNQYSIRFCSVLKSWEYTAYVFDLWGRSGKNTRLAGENSMAFISSELQIPRFSLMPKMKIPGFLSGMLNSLTEKLLAQHGGRVEFPDVPSFEETFIVAGENHDAIRKLLSGPVMDFLTSRNPYQIEADADMVVISAPEFRRRPAAAGQGSLQNTVSEMTALFELLAKK
jgi:hypothetical protein